MVKDKIKTSDIWDELLYLLLKDIATTQTFKKGENIVLVSPHENTKGYEKGEVVRKYE
jgi:hypothetical protein